MDNCGWISKSIREHGCNSLRHFVNGSSIVVLGEANQAHVGEMESHYFVKKGDGLAGGLL